MIVAVVGVVAGKPVRFIISSSGARVEGMSWVTSFGSAENATAQLIALVGERLLPGNSRLSFT